MFERWQWHYFLTENNLISPSLLIKIPLLLYWCMWFLDNLSSAVNIFCSMLIPMSNAMYIFCSMLIFMSNTGVQTCFGLWLTDFVPWRNFIVSIFIVGVTIIAQAPLLSSMYQPHLSVYFWNVVPPGWQEHFRNQTCGVQCRKQPRKRRDSEQPNQIHRFLGGWWTAAAAHIATRGMRSATQHTYPDKPHWVSLAGTVQGMCVRGFA